VARNYLGARTGCWDSEAVRPIVTEADRPPGQRVRDALAANGGWLIWVPVAVLLGLDLWSWLAAG
jgi:hypothetical protein